MRRQAHRSGHSLAVVCPLQSRRRRAVQTDHPPNRSYNKANKCYSFALPLTYILCICFSKGFGPLRKRLMNGIAKWSRLDHRLYQWSETSIAMLFYRELYHFII
mmetsp:Transcript_838/g.2023  ORF Transcript_838/g.2023 Transcript_838/m.2023 type:complete len:104 (+) Transcript_838:1039-1350(+)